jgi:hypothetical protein
LPIGFVRTTGDGQSVLELAVDDGVSTHYQGSRLVNLLLPTRQNCREHLERQLAGGKRDDVERSERLASHGVDVGQCVGGRDLPEVEWIIHNGGEEVNSLNEGQIVGHSENSRIVESLSSDQQSRICLDWKRGQRAG